MKNFELIPLAQENSKQSGLDSVIWFLVATLMKIYNEKEQAVQAKLQNEIFEEKREPVSGIEITSVFKGINGLRNRIKGVVISGQDPTR